jgi:hypothetical protein
MFETVVSASLAISLLAVPVISATDGATTIAVVAAGQINTDGSIQQNFNVVKATFSQGCWQIRLKGPASSFSYRDFIVVATAIDDAPILATTSSAMGRLFVYLQDLETREYVKENFSFVVYQIKTTALAK